MFAIAFDLTIADARRHHPKRALQAYSDIAAVLEQHGFNWAQGSVYISENEDLANLLLAMNDLKALPWFRRWFETYVRFVSNNGRTSRAL